MSLAHPVSAQAGALRTLAPSFACSSIKLRSTGLQRGFVSPSCFTARRVCPRQRLTPIAAADVIGVIKLALPAGKANPAPPVGPALGQKQVNIMQFCKEYNAATQDKTGTIIPVEITVYRDKSFTFVLKTSPASTLLAKAAGIAKGSGTANGAPVGTVTAEQVKEIATTKLPDLNCSSLESAIRTVAGTARSMGVRIQG